jgi:hypothetical protein
MRLLSSQPPLYGQHGLSPAGHQQQVWRCLLQVAKRVPPKVQVDVRKSTTSKQRHSPSFEWIVQQSVVVAVAITLPSIRTALVPSLSSAVGPITMHRS